jgi:hypothetical protein
VNAVAEEGDRRFELGGVPLVVYAAMFGATLGGQFLGMAFDAVALGRRVLWVPLACSVVLEAVAGARFGAARLGRALASGERLRVSVYYSLALTMLSVPLAGWLAAAKASHAEPGAASGGAGPDLAFLLVVGLGGLVAYTALRTALMAVFAGRRA